MLLTSLSRVISCALHTAVGRSPHGCLRGFFLNHLRNSSYRSASQLPIVYPVINVPINPIACKIALAMTMTKGLAEISSRQLSSCVGFTMQFNRSRSSREKAIASPQLGIKLATGALGAPTATNNASANRFVFHVVPSVKGCCLLNRAERPRWKLLEPSWPAIVGEEIDHGTEKLVLVIVCQSVGEVVGID